MKIISSLSCICIVVISLSLPSDGLGVFKFLLALFHPQTCKNYPELCHPYQRRPQFYPTVRPNDVVEETFPAENSIVFPSEQSEEATRRPPLPLPYTKKFTEMMATSARPSRTTHKRPQPSMTPSTKSPLPMRGADVHMIMRGGSEENMGTGDSTNTTKPTYTSPPPLYRSSTRATRATTAVTEGAGENEIPDNLQTTKSPTRKTTPRQPSTSTAKPINNDERENSNQGQSPGKFTSPPSLYREKEESAENSEENSNEDENRGGGAGAPMFHPQQEDSQMPILTSTSSWKIIGEDTSEEEMMQGQESNNSKKPYLINWETSQFSYMTKKPLKIPNLGRPSISSWDQNEVHYTPVRTTSFPRKPSVTTHRTTPRQGNSHEYFDEDFAQEAPRPTSKPYSTKIPWKPTTNSPKHENDSDYSNEYFDEKVTTPHRAIPKTTSKPTTWETSVYADDDYSVLPHSDTGPYGEGNVQTILESEDDADFAPTPVFTSPPRTTVKTTYKSTPRTTVPPSTTHRTYTTTTTKRSNFDYEYYTDDEEVEEEVKTTTTTTVRPTTPKPTVRTTSRGPRSTTRRSAKTTVADATSVKQTVKVILVDWQKPFRHTTPGPIYVVPQY